MMTTAGIDSLLPLIFILLPIIISSASKKKKKREAALRKQPPSAAKGRGGGSSPPPPSKPLKSGSDELPDWVRKLASELGSELPQMAPEQEPEVEPIESWDVSPEGMEFIAEPTRTLEVQPATPDTHANLQGGPDLEKLRLDRKQRDRDRGYVSMKTTSRRGNRRGKSPLLPDSMWGWRRALVMREILDPPKADKPWHPVGLSDS